MKLKNISPLIPATLVLIVSMMNGMQHNNEGQKQEMQKRPRVEINTKTAKQLLNLIEFNRLGEITTLFPALKDTRTINDIVDTEGNNALDYLVIAIDFYFQKIETSLRHLYQDKKHNLVDMLLNLTSYGACPTHHITIHILQALFKDTNHFILFLERYFGEKNQLETKKILEDEFQKINDNNLNYFLMATYYYCLPRLNDKDKIFGIMDFITQVVKKTTLKKSQIPLLTRTLCTISDFESPIKGQSQPIFDKILPRVWARYISHFFSEYNSSVFHIDEMLINLVNMGANINTPIDEHDNTLLHHATSNNLKKIVQTLIYLHADPKRSNKQRITPINIAQISSNYSILMLLDPTKLPTKKLSPYNTLVNQEITDTLLHMIQSNALDQLSQLFPELKNTRTINDPVDKWKNNAIDYLAIVSNAYLENIATSAPQSYQNQKKCLKEVIGLFVSCGARANKSKSLEILKKING